MATAPAGDGAEPAAVAEGTTRSGSLQWPLLAWYAATGAMGAAAAWVAIATWYGPTRPAALVGAVVAGALVGAVAGYRVTWDLKRRLRPLGQGVRIFAAGGLRHRIPVEGDDELAELAAAMNGMAERHARQVEALQRLAEERALLSGEAARAAVLEERQRLARDLHDAVSQAIFSIAMTTAAARRLLASDPARAEARMAEVESLAAAAQNEMRALLLELRPVELAGRPLGEALGQLIGEIGERHGFDARFAVEGDAEALGPALEDGMFRIAQEAVVNAVRHARPRRIEVRLAVDAGAATLAVADDGQGFDAAAAPPDTHYGLRSMRERAQELGGTFDVRSAPGRGTRVEVRLPRLETSAREEA
jgi:NarL family two-component system sensor histidine kinase LiaS